MRILLSSLVAAGLLTSNLAAAQCARPADHSAFDVAGLKSQLMVTALTCSADQRYNAFVMKYRPDLVAQEKLLNTYFSRAYGRAAVKRHDDYITQLANSQSQSGLKQGTLFCERNIGIFDEVMALHSGAELPDFAAGKALAQPVSLADCGPAVAPRHPVARKPVARKIVHRRS